MVAKKSKIYDVITLGIIFLIVLGFVIAFFPYTGLAVYITEDDLEFLFTLSFAVVVIVTLMVFMETTGNEEEKKISK